jgi:transcription antitermination factor NusG
MGAGVERFPTSGIPQWYAVHTRSHFEKRVADELLTKEVETYLPASREVHQWKDRKKVVNVPVFPGYVFVRISDDSGIRLRVVQTNGAIRILGHGYDIEPIPDAEIEAVRKLVDSGLPLLSHPFLKEGARVRIRRGALEGIEGLLSRFKDRTRIVVSIEMLSRSVSTEIDMHNVEVLRPAAAGLRSGVPA